MKQYSKKYKIGYYIHHHGDGHRQRALAIASYAPEYFTLLGTNLAGNCDNFDYIDLEDDKVAPGYRRHNEYLVATHYTPIGVSSIKQLVQRITQWIAKTEPALIVVDVSVEIAMLARLCSTPTIYVRLTGNRLDTAHIEAFSNANALLCPYHRLLEANDTPDWIIKKSHFFSNLTQFYNKQKNQQKIITIVLGAGGHDLSIDRLIEIARQLPLWQLEVIGPIDAKKTTQPLPKNLKLNGWVKNPETYIQKANLVIGSSGDGLLANVISANKPYICLPQRRPFEEQWAKAKRLQEIGAAIVPQGTTINWAELVTQTLNKGNLMGLLQDGQDAAKAAQFILTTAHGSL
ncbi:MAG: glycosyltransferase [Alphaproteobacteria bacterium]|nr:glycosyltransferase [Alphaproteobacteria bacterium]